MLKTVRLLFFALTLTCWMVIPGGVRSAENPHGLPPAEDMVFIPHLKGLKNKSYKNHSGQEKHLSEAIVLRESEVSKGQAQVPPGGLFYLSETEGQAEPLMGDPFLVLGEHTYLVDLVSGSRTVKGVKVAKGEKLPIGETGYRLWFDYATDHYEKPYAQLALVSPSGGWPLEFPIASAFPGRDGVRKLGVKEGSNEQLKPFFLDKAYLFGASQFVAKDIGFESAEFESIKFPVITEATFSMHRPIVMEIRQEDYRFYFDKRIYAFRRPDGFLVRVTNFTGSKVYAEKLIKPVTVQNYKTLASEKDKYHLTIPELDLRIEIKGHPTILKHSDFVPWSASHSHGFSRGTLSFVIYRRLITVRNGEPWPLDKRYRVGLEPNLMSGMLQRLVIENAQPITFNNNNDSYSGPVKYSNIWNRPAFNVVARRFDAKGVHELYVRDYFLMRTDNMVFMAKEGRQNIDFFVGSSPALEPILESTFLTRLADSAFGTIVEGSHFSSYPKVVSNASFYEPDPTAPFVPRLKGLQRKISRNRKDERLLSSESFFIRGSYVDYRNGKIVIPPAGLCYSSRNARNIRTLAGESFFMLGKRAYLTSFKSSTFVRKNFNLDFWKNQRMGDDNLMYWQDQLLGVRNKTLRFTKHFYLDDRPVVELSLMKYSGNRWEAHFLMAQGFDDQGDNRYTMPDTFAEGATWIIPEYVGTNYVKIKEIGTPSMESVSFTYKEPEMVTLGPGEKAPLGKFVLECRSVNTKDKTVSLVLKDERGVQVDSKTLGPLNAEAVSLLPQFQNVIRTLQLIHGDVQAELDIKEPFDGGKARLYLFTDIETMERDTAFRFDPRFKVRPDVCGHCYQLNEVLLDNPETIILDKNHRVYEGPKNKEGKPLFRIVIDHFDGEMIHAWHVETFDKGKVQKSENLAFRPRNNIDVLVGVNGTTEGFLRLSMLPRLGFMEYWRVSAKGPASKLTGSVNTGGSAHIAK
ncbi:MAG TPA: hypothetical protein VK564_06985 [Thermodesulfobacteriota bacterium]|nr:hypothetical protein [Thermodesulfobacteriota bacterium]